MDSRCPAVDAADPEAVDFVRFCRERRRVAWPELYDEMWAVASRGLFRGYDFVALEERGIRFSLFGTPQLAAMSAAVIEEERAAGGRPSGPPGAGRGTSRVAALSPAR